MMKEKLLNSKPFLIVVFIALLVLPVALCLMPIQWLTPTVGSDYSFCIWKNITGHDCWGCGMTRAFVNIMHGHFEAAWQCNKLVVAAFPVMVYLWAVNVYRLAFRYCIVMKTDSNRTRK